MIACFLSNISAKYYKNPSMLSRVIAKNVGDVFFETQCIYNLLNVIRHILEFLFIIISGIYFIFVNIWSTIFESAFRRIFIMKEIIQLWQLFLLYWIGQP